MDNEKSYGPFTIDVVVWVTDGEQIGKMTWGGYTARPMPMKKIKNILDECESSIKESMGNDWRLCTKQEFYNGLFAEKTGSTTRFAIPGQREWDIDVGEQEEAPHE